MHYFDFRQTPISIQPNNPQHFVQEDVGAMLDMDIGLYHEVTEIQPGEPTKYSLCLLYE